MATKLYQKILNVMKQVEYLSKDDNIRFGNTNYKAISEGKVTSTVRTALIAEGLVILPVEQEHTRVDTVSGDGKIHRLTTVNTRYAIVDVSTGEERIIVSSGTGVDTQDKGVGKAMTYALKYALLRTFLIPTGDDPDKTSSAELDKKIPQSRYPKPSERKATFVEMMDSQQDRLGSDIYFQVLKDQGFFAAEEITDRAQQGRIYKLLEAEKGPK